MAEEEKEDICGHLGNRRERVRGFTVIRDILHYHETSHTFASDKIQYFFFEIGKTPRSRVLSSTFAPQRDEDPHV